MNLLAVFEPPFRSVKVLGHARGQPCTLRLSGFCNRNWETTVSAHIRDRHKGMGTKASDHSIVFACSDCHVALDEGRWVGKLDIEEVLRAIIQGLQETWEILIRDRIIGFPHDRPKPFLDRPVKPRKPKELRTEIRTGAKLPKGRKLQSRRFT